MDKPPRLDGDAWEYWYQLESFYQHGSPELRPADRVAVEAAAYRATLPPASKAPYAYAAARDGRLYGVHFWAYALSAVPAKEALSAFGRNELSALGVANAAWFLLGIGFTIFLSKAPFGERLALAALASVGPAIWYLGWNGAEMFSWSLVLVAVAAYRDRRSGIAGLAAGLAATQNPTAIFLGVAAIGAAMWEWRRFAAARAFLGTAVGLFPFAFFVYHFGKPNLIASEYSSVDNLSFVRTWGFFTDLNHGLLPYMPWLVLGSVAGAIRLTYFRNIPGLLLVAGGAAMGIAAEVQHNWNSDCIGLQRYLVWMVPVAAGVAVEGLADRRRWLWAFAAVAVACHASILVAYERLDSLHNGYLDHTPLARAVLTRCPRAYWVDPEVFVERVQHRDGWPLEPAPLPVAFSRVDGTVSKVLLDAESVGRLGSTFEVDPTYLLEITERATRESGVFFAHPSVGTVRVREEGKPH